MGKGDWSGGPATQTCSSALAYRCGESCDTEEGSARSEPSATTGPDKSNVWTRTRPVQLVVPPSRRPLSNEYRRLDSLVLLKQEIKKLQNEIKELRDGERRRTEDIRSQAQIFKAEMAQMGRSSSRESQKLLCELRTKDRIIGKLEKELATLRSSWSSISSNQKDEPPPAARKGKKGDMPPHTAKERTEVSRADSERTGEERPDVQTATSGASQVDVRRIAVPEHMRDRRPRPSRSILEFINSELMDNQVAHKTVVFVGDDADGPKSETYSPAESSFKEVLRIDVPSRRGALLDDAASPVVLLRTCPDGRDESHVAAPSRAERESAQVQTECRCQCRCSEVTVSRSVQTDESDLISVGVQSAEEEAVERMYGELVEDDRGTVLQEPEWEPRKDGYVTVDQEPVREQREDGCGTVDHEPLREAREDGCGTVDHEPLRETREDGCGTVDQEPEREPREDTCGMNHQKSEQEPTIVHSGAKSTTKQEGESGAVLPTSTSRFHSRVPVGERRKSDAFSCWEGNTAGILTKVVSLETLYGVLMEEHVGVVSDAREQVKRANLEKRKRVELESRLSRAGQNVEALRRANRDMETRLTELTEQNDLLEFRLLEMEDDDAPPKRAVSRGSETGRWELGETQDDVSDSGVMSLPTSEDEQYSLCSSECSSEVIKGRLVNMCRQTDNMGDRACLEDTVALLRHYETRLHALDSLALSSVRYGDCHESKCGRIVATVPPFSSGETPRGPENRDKEIDPLQESGIFVETHFSCHSQGTQTDLPDTPGDLSQEIRKLVQIRECIEESKTGCTETRELHYLRERLSILEGRIRQYEALPEHSETRTRVELEAVLRAQIKRLEERVEQLEEENTKLEEICSELEEQENDTRLRCQKLESKVSSLGEKKIGLKSQLELNARTIAELKSLLSEEERKRTEARQAAARMETLVHQYEKKNFELEERETEVRYRLQVLENTLPAIMMWNMWRMMAVMQAGEREREGELLHKLKSVENELVNENSLLEQSRKAEVELKGKVQKLEELLDSGGQDAEQTQQMNDQVVKLAKDHQEKDKRIQELELREKLYQETLQQADTMFAEMETDYTRQIGEKENQLRDKELKLTEAEAKMRRLNKEWESSALLQDRLLSMESDLKSSKDNLIKKELERAALKHEEERIRTELNTCLEEIHTLKSSLSTSRSELDGEKRCAKELRELVNKLEDENSEVQNEFEFEVHKYKKQIKKLGMELMESEVTISELREEVQTLEVAVKELREELRLEKERSESIRVRLESELEESCRKIEYLEGIGVSTKGLSLQEELNMSSWQNCEADLGLRDTPIPAMRTSPRRSQKSPTPQPRKIKDSVQT